MTISSSSSEDEDEYSQATTATPAATESAAVTDAAAPDDCCEVCDRFALVPCGHAQLCLRKVQGELHNFIPNKSRAVYPGDVTSRVFSRPRE